MAETHEAAPPLDFTQPGTFPYITLKDRMPKILSQTIDAAHQALASSLDQFGAEQVTQERKSLSALAQLRHEMQTNKPLRPLEDKDPDVDLWNAEMARVAGCDWYAATWLLVECYMYRRIREALLAGGPLMRALDPFLQQKHEAFAASRPAVSAMMRFVLAHESDDILESLLLYSLWANRADLSLFTSVDSATANQVDSVASLHARDEFVLCTHAAKVSAHVKALSGRSVALVLDNAGLELAADLALAYWLTRGAHTSKVLFYVKRIPWFVSDVVHADIEWTLAHLADMEGLSPFVEHCRAFLASGTWEIVEEPFWTLPHDFTALPALAPSLHTDLSRCGLAILKGDLNYRKLLGDRAWQPDTPLARAAAPWPCPYVAVRTLKSPVIAGLARDAATRAAGKEDTWMTSGNYGVIQSSLSFTY